MAYYVIGADFGTLSVRCVLINLENPEEEYSAVSEYKHAVMDDALPCGLKLETNFALQHPQDYIDSLKAAASMVLQQSGISASDILGIGLDFTSCTLIPVDESFSPLCFHDEFKNEPHAYAKLWKHHGAQPEADLMNEIAVKHNEEWLADYGGKVSSEWMFPKILEIANKAPDVFAKTYRFIEAGDWIAWYLTGKEIHSSCMAGYKGMWSKKRGFPSNEYFKAVSDKLDAIIGTKVSACVDTVGSNIGTLSENGKAIFGDNCNASVAVPIIDAHVALPAAGITTSGTMLVILGTSACHMILSDEHKKAEGICGVVEDGIIPGYFAYEAGQSCSGDHFDWFIKNCVPYEYTKEADDKNINIHQLLSDKAAKEKPGSSGLLALDWWNGNRTPLVDVSLTGMILGMNLKTKPEEIYRALIEATAYGTRLITEVYEKSGIEFNNIIASGGIAEKNPFLMQIYADVCNKTINVAKTKQAGALGSAIFAADACGYFKNIDDASRALKSPVIKTYTPNPENVAIYNELFSEYKKLVTYFGKENNVMKKLLKLKSL